MTHASIYVFRISLGNEQGRTFRRISGKRSEKLPPPRDCNEDERPEKPLTLTVR